MDGNNQDFMEERKPSQDRAWLYIRTAYPNEKDSPSYQISCVRQFAKKNKLYVVGETIAIENGRFLERYGLSKVSDAVEAGLVDVILVQNLSRISMYIDRVSEYSSWASKFNVQVLVSGELSMADMPEIWEFEHQKTNEMLNSFFQDINV